jgi:hypothetical protein
MFFNPENHPHLLRKKYVNQIFSGKKTTNNNSTDIECLVFGVSKKESKENLNAEDLIPDSIDGIPTDVIETPLFHQQGFCPEINFETLLPVCSDHARTPTGKQSSCLINGTSIGSIHDTGTLGIPLFNSKTNCVVNLTCNHAAGGTIKYPTQETGRSFLVKNIDKDFLFSELNESINTEQQFTHSPAFNQAEGSFSRLESGMTHCFIGESGMSDNPLLFYSDYSSIFFLSTDDLLELTGRQYPKSLYCLPFTTSINVSNNTQTVFNLLPFGETLTSTPVYSSELFSDPKVIDIDQGKFKSSEEFLNYFSGKDYKHAFEITTNGIKIFNSKDVLIYNNGPITEERPWPILTNGDKLEIYINPDGSDYTESGYFYGDSPFHGGTKIHNRLEFLYFGLPPCYSKNNQDAKEEYLGGEVLEDHSENFQAEIFYPGPEDALDSEPKLIGRSNSRPIKFDHPLNTNLYSGNFISFNKMDVAFINILKDFIPTVHFLDLMVGDIKISDPILGAKVFKSGRTTGATPTNSIHQATIDSIDWSGRISYCNNENTTQSNAFFSDCFSYTSSENFAFNLRGDSGSAIFMEHQNDLHLVGIHFAGSLNAGQSKTIGLGFKMSNLLDSYKDLSIWNGDYSINKSNTNEDAAAFKICSDCYVKSPDLDGKNFLSINVDSKNHSTFENTEECY